MTLTTLMVSEGFYGFSLKGVFLGNLFGGFRGKVWVIKSKMF